jgi:hypothetical protein
VSRTGVVFEDIEPGARSSKSASKVADHVNDCFAEALPGLSDHDPAKLDAVTVRIKYENDEADKVPVTVDRIVKRVRTRELAVVALEWIRQDEATAVGDLESSNPRKLVNERVSKRDCQLVHLAIDEVIEQRAGPWKAEP